MDNYQHWCFIDTRQKRVQFIPEKKIEEIEFNKTLWERTFPKQKGVDIKKLKLTNIGQYSIAKYNITKRLHILLFKLYNLHILSEQKIDQLVITESNGGMGGLTIALARHFKHVNSVEIVPHHCKIILNNIKQYNLEKKVTVVSNDYMNVMLKLKQDIIIADPPWGGPDYYKQEHLRLSLNNIDITCIINKLYNSNSFKIFALIAPKNFDIKHFIKNIQSSSIYVKKYEPLNIIFVFNNTMAKKL